MGGPGKYSSVSSATRSAAVEQQFESCCLFKPHFQQFAIIGKRFPKKNSVDLAAVTPASVRWAGTTIALHINGAVAQMVERALSMREVRGSIPRSSKFFFFHLLGFFFSLGFPMFPGLGSSGCSPVAV